MDCGPSCLTMISNHFGKKYDLSYIREKCYLTRNGVSLLGISQCAVELGFNSTALKLTFQDLFEISLPCILHWNRAHFVVLYKIQQKFGKNFFYIADPAHGYIKLNEKDFLSNWNTSGINKGVCLVLQPTSLFYENTIPEHRNDYRFLLNYLKPFRLDILKIFAGLIIGSCITLVLPFLTQYMVDMGIQNKDLGILQLIVIFQITLFIGSTVIEIFRNRFFLHIGTRININILSDFLSKLMVMPLKYFDSKRTGDLIQRIEDHKRIEVFITSNALLTVFSLVTFSVFFLVLAYYDLFILLVYLILTVISVGWALFFQRQRKILDYKRFGLQAKDQSNTYELINGIEEIQLNSFEEYKKNKWKEIQEHLYTTNLKVLNVDQFQLNGFNLINNLKNIIVTFIVAKSVISGALSLGNMLSISYIIGQMNSPINQLISFFRTALDARLSFNRLNEIHNKDLSNTTGLACDFNNAPIMLSNICFQYEGPKSPFVLKNIDLTIQNGKITAIVGQSGSGKSTLMKLLLKYYEPIEGDITINNTPLERYSFDSWRKKYGVVSQEGFIFSDTIEQNIVTGDLNIDQKKLEYAAKMANVDMFIADLPLGYGTKIGEAGIGISGGQKQRILIARAVYKNPEYLFFDEASSALDAENEKIIHDNLQSFFKGKTVLIIAHRLSTVKNADQIIVLKQGKVVEQGNHKKLVSIKGEYYNLVKNQLELDN